MELIKWVVLHPLILTVFWVLGGQEIPQGIQSESVVYSVDANQSASEQVHNLDVSTLFWRFGGLEIEVEEDDDDDDHYANRKSSQSPSIPPALSKRPDGSLLPTQKLIKLYILFHSWKSFLFN